MEEESLSGQAIASVSLLYLLFFRLYFHSHSLTKLPPQAHLFPMAACPFLEKQTPRAPLSSFSHLSPPLPSSFSICSTTWFSCSLMLPFLSLSFFPVCPLWTGCDRSDGLLLWESKECALWLALECCYDLNRRSPLCSSPHSHQCRSSQRVSLTWLHTQQHQSSSNPPEERQLSCNGFYIPLLLLLLPLFLLFLIIRSAAFESKRICTEKSFQDHLIFEKFTHMLKLLLRPWVSNKFAKAYSWLCWVSLPLSNLGSTILALSPCLPLGAVLRIPAWPVPTCLKLEMCQKTAPTLCLWGTPNTMLNGHLLWVWQVLFLCYA